MRAGPLRVTGIAICWRKMALEVSDLRPAVLRPESQFALLDYLEFRHVVRNVYTFNLRPDRVKELVQGLRPVFLLVQRDLLDFASFLEDLSSVTPGEDAITDEK